MVNFKEHFVNRVEYNFPIFEASKELKDDIEELMKNDKKGYKLKKLAIKNSENVNDYLKYIYKTYEKKIDEYVKIYDVYFDDIVQVFLSV